MRKHLLAPGAYVQGEGVIAAEESFTTLQGTTAFVLGGETALSMTESALQSGLESAGLDVAAIEPRVDSCTFDRIDSLADDAAVDAADTIIGVGGGVALDTSKAVADALDAELVTVPTIESTDAPCSSVSVVYDEAGGFDGYVHRDRDPDLVIVDTGIIVQAPARFLQHGMGDAFATRFEAEAVAQSSEVTHTGAHSTGTALTLARLTFDNLQSYGEAAMAASERDAVTPAFEHIVETNTLLSGLGFESGGLAAAHAFGKGFSKADVDAPHGRLIAVSTIAQLVLEDREPDILESALDLYHTLGLDCRLTDFEITDAAVETVAENACNQDTTMSNEPVDVTPGNAAAALRTADELIARY